MRGFHFHLKRTTKRIIFSALLFAFALILTTSRAPTSLEIIQQRGVLKVITTPGSTTYFNDAKGQGGFEYLLTKAFAKDIGVKLDIELMDSLKTMMIAVGGPRGDLIAAGLAITPQRQQKLRFSTPYDQTSQMVIYRSGNKRPRTIEDLFDRQLLAIANSSHSEQLQKLKLQHPQLSWEEKSEADMLELMQLVHNSEVEHAIVDSSSYLVDRSLYPKVRTAFEISEPQQLAWALPLHTDDSLLNAVNRFLEEYQSSGKLARLKERFYGHIEKFSVAGSQLFMRRINSRLPKYEALFKSTAREHNLDWHLLAAIAYQESHWNPKARSPTGVRGLMMLTRPTAKEMGVKNRLNAEQSMSGGTRYFLKIKRRIPEQIVEPDRSWFAMAAYNIGLGHLEDARVLTDRADKNPNLWEDVREFLPLLQQKKYYSTVKYGYARGKEPVQYVQNIRHYRNILTWNTREKQQQLEQNAPAKIPSSSNLGHDSLLSL